MEVVGLRILPQMHAFTVSAPTSFLFKICFHPRFSAQSFSDVRLRWGHRGAALRHLVGAFPRGPSCCWYHRHTVPEAGHVTSHDSSADIETGEESPFYSARARGSLLQ